MHHFDLSDKLHEAGLDPEHYDSHGDQRGTADAKYAVHNYEDRSFIEIVPCDELFLAHFPHAPMHRRVESQIDSGVVLGNFRERFTGLDEEETIAEADRCMSCGMC